MVKEQDTTQETPNTIFDDVFRTIAEKFPYMFIGLINEFFHTDYPEDTAYKELKNEHYTKNGKVVTDALFEIQSHLYHIECQSGKDGRMVLRMFEYDVAIALENASGTDEVTEISFPESCVIYVRNHRTVQKQHTLMVRFPNGQKVCYTVPIVKVSDYSVDEIFQKRLIAFLPYYILRYESFLKSNSINEKKTEQLLNEMRDISKQLETYCEENESAYIDMMNLIKRICDYIIPDGKEELKERMDDVMGGQVLKLQSEILREQGIEQGRTEGIEQGRTEGRAESYYEMVQDGLCPVCVAAQKLQIPDAEFEKCMKAAGYKIPEPV